MPHTIRRNTPPRLATLMHLLWCCALLAGFALPHAARAATPRNTDWLRDAKWGVMMHYLADEASDTSAPAITPAQWNTRVNAFDVNGLADQLQTVGAKYFVLTLGQNSGYFISPNATYDGYVGRSPSRLATRDLPNDLYTALNSRGIKLMLYISASAPVNDQQARDALPLARWADVAREWSQRYGSKIAGWWLDGGCGVSTMYDALRAGNSNALVGTNCGGVGGVADDPPNQDYTGGEVRYPERSDFTGPQTRFVGDSQAHILTFLGGDWGRPDARYDDATVLSVTQKLTDYQGVVTWDVPYQKANGLLAPDAFAAMYKLNQNLNGGAPNLALGKATGGSGSQCSGGEGFANATDGNKSSQWCSNFSGAATLNVDLGTSQNLEAVIVRHAEEAGGPWYNNTHNYTVQRSANGVDGWTTVATVADNGSDSLGIEGSRYTGSRLDTSARYLRLSITGGDFWNNTTARISEVEVYAKAGSPPPAASLPAPWQTSDIGSVGQTGAASESTGTFTVSGSGSDIWGNSDQFRYVYQTMNGDGSIVARLAAQTNTDGWAKAGVMIRESTAPGAKHALLAVTPNNGIVFQRRVDTNSATSNSGTGGGVPVWLRLTRTGTTITAATSANGSTWTTLGSDTISMSSSVLVGFAVTAHTNGATSTATYTNVTVGTNGGGTPTSNVALNKAATADSQCSGSEEPAKAVNGSTNGGNSDKWCSAGSSKFLRVDLGASYSITRLVVKHAGAGGENTAWNTRDFTVQLSNDNGTTWTTPVNVTGNTASVTTHDISATTARLVRLNINTPASDGNGAARIYELEVYGN